MVRHQAESVRDDPVFPGGAIVKRDVEHAVFEAVKDNASSLSPDVYVLWYPVLVNPLFQNTPQFKQALQM